MSKKVKGEEEMTPEHYLLRPEDFEIVYNPRILGEAVTEEYDWEYCLSFPTMRCMVKRPVAIHVSYFNQEGDEVEQKLFSHAARVFLHELDHLEGRSMLHWSLSEGNIDVIHSVMPQENLMTTVEFYKQKIDSLKSSFHHMFEDHRKFETIVNPDDG